MTKKTVEFKQTVNFMATIRELKKKEKTTSDNWIAGEYGEQAQWWQGAMLEAIREAA